MGCSSINCAPSFGGIPTARRGCRAGSSRVELIGSRGGERRARSQGASPKAHRAGTESPGPQRARAAHSVNEELLAIHISPYGSLTQGGEEIRAQEAGEVHEDHGVEQQEVGHQEGPLALHLHVAHEVPGEVHLGRQAEGEVHHQVDVLVGLIERRGRHVAHLQQHADGEEDVAHLHQQQKHRRHQEAARDDERDKGRDGHGVVHQVLPGRAGLLVEDDVEAVVDEVA